MFLRVLLFKEGIRSRQFYINYANANKNIQASVTKRLFSSVSVLNSNSSDANPCAGLDATNYSLSQSLNPTTSILKRYQQFQQDHPEHLILMQVGDFYEIYGSPVAAAAKILEIAITRTPGKLTSPMTGFPVRSFDTFLGKLVRAGISVVVADQVEMVNGTGRFDRQVTRIITPGTLLEENLLDPARNNFILCLDPVKKSCAWMDVSTGDFFTTTCEKESALISLLACLKPREILVEEGNDVLSSEIKSLFNRSQTFLTKLSKSKDNEIEIEKLTQNSESDSEFPLTQIELKLSCKLLNFVKNSLRSTLSAVKPLKRFAPAKHFMAIDADSFRSLDILFASNSSEKSSNSNNSHSLFTTLNECKTALGSRLLARKLQAPLLDPFQINSALDRVESLIGQGENTLASFRRKLDEVGDIERILQRLCLRRPQGVSRDLRSLARSLISATEALNILSVTDNNTTKPRVNRTLPLSESLLAHLKKISEAFNEKLPLRDSDGGLFLPKWDFKLDELRRLRDDSSAVFSELAASYRQSTGIPNLRIIPFKGDQQVVEVSKSTILPSDSKIKLSLNIFTFIFCMHVLVFRPLMQTETRARYTTEELLTKSLLLRTISERVIDHELVLLNSLLEPLIVNSAEIRAAADSIALIDLDSSFALLAIKQDYTRPIINNEAHLDILDGRHPVLDKLFSNPLESTDTIRYFTPNSLSLNEESNLYY